MRLDFKKWYSAEGCHHKDAIDVLADGEAGSGTKGPLFSFGGGPLIIKKVLGLG